MIFEIGKKYKVNHSRKGEFVIIVESESEEWVQGEILEGETETINPNSSKGEGEKIDIRKSLAEFTLLN